MSSRRTDARNGRARRDRLLGDERGDPYRERGKLPEPTVCPDCGAVVREGRWQWCSAPFGAAEHRCPACRRIRDDYPGGHLALTGEFQRDHRDEIINLARNLEEREKALHPLERIMDVRDENDALVITTTGVHLVRGIANAVAHAYKGELDFHYEDGETLLRMHWHR